ncbi:MAG: GspH/FimT family pseudopilin [Telluria sp.]
MRLAEHVIGLQRNAGFSMSEMLVTVAVVAVTTSIGLPMVSGFIDDAAVSGTADQTLAGLHYTRSEAVKRNTRVTMCRSSDGSACAAAAAGDAEWGGWIVFVDGDETGSVDDGDEILRVQGALASKGRLIGSGGMNNYVSYMSNGQARDADGAAQTGSFYSCAVKAGAKRRKITLTAGTGWVGVDIIAAAAACAS